MKGFDKQRSQEKSAGIDTGQAIDEFPKQAADTLECQDDWRITG